MSLKTQKTPTFSGLFQGLSLKNLFSSDSNLYRERSPESDLIEVVGTGRGYEELVDLENSGQLYHERILFMIKGLALEAAEFGAPELFIGHPEEFRYEFFVGDVGYQGSIDPKDYLALLKLFGKETELEFQVDHFEVEALTLSLTSNHSNPVVHVGWRHRWINESATNNPFAQ